MIKVTFALLTIIFSSAVYAVDIIPPGTTYFRKNNMGGYNFYNRNGLTGKSKANAMNGQTYSNRGKLQAKTYTNLFSSKTEANRSPKAK